VSHHRGPGSDRRICWRTADSNASPRDRGILNISTAGRRASWRCPWLDTSSRPQSGRPPYVKRLTRTDHRQARIPPTIAERGSRNVDDFDRPTHTGFGRERVVHPAKPRDQSIARIGCEHRIRSMSLTSTSSRRPPATRTGRVPPAQNRRPRGWHRESEPLIPRPAVANAALPDATDINFAVNRHNDQAQRRPRAGVRRSLKLGRTFTDQREALWMLDRLDGQVHVQVWPVQMMRSGLWTRTSCAIEASRTMETFSTPGQFASSTSSQKPWRETFVTSAAEVRLPRCSDFILVLPHKPQRGGKAAWASARSSARRRCLASSQNLARRSRGEHERASLSLPEKEVEPIPPHPKDCGTHRIILPEMLSPDSLNDGRSNAP